MERKKPDINDPKVLEDGVRLLKSDFTNLYVELGFDRSLTSVLWHQIRMSPKGQAMRDQIPSSKLNGAVSFISDVKEEAAERLKKKKKSPEKEQETVNDKSNLNTNTMAKGEKAKQVKALVDKGITDVDTIVEKIGANKLYVKNLLKKFGVSEAPKKEKDEKPAKEKKEKPVKVKKEKLVKEIPTEEVVIEEEPSDVEDEGVELEGDAVEE